MLIRNGFNNGLAYSELYSAFDNVVYVKRTYIKLQQLVSRLGSNCYLLLTYSPMRIRAGLKNYYQLVEHASSFAFSLNKTRQL